MMHASDRIHYEHQPHDKVGSHEVFHEEVTLATMNCRKECMGVLSITSWENNTNESWK